MSSASQQQKDASSSGSTQPSTSSATSSNNTSMKVDEKSSLGKRPRGVRSGTKRRLDAGQKPRQLIRYDRDSLLQLRDSRLSAAWPRALDRAFVGEGGLWDPVRLFEGEKKVVTDGKTKIERVRNVRVTQPYNAAPLSAEDSHSYGRSSRRRKRTKEETPVMLVGPQQKQRGWPAATAGAGVGSANVNSDASGGASSSLASRSKSESEKENKKDPQQRSRGLQDEAGFTAGPRGVGVAPPPRLGAAAAAAATAAVSAAVGAAAAAGAGGFSRRPGRGANSNGKWERSQGPREHHHHGGLQRHRGVEEEEMPAWFDEGPLDNMEKLELTGLPEDMEAAEEATPLAQHPHPQHQQQPLMPPRREQPQLAAEGGRAPSRFAKWLAAEPPPSMHEPPPQLTGQDGARGGAQQNKGGASAQNQLERIFQDLRGRRPPDAKQQQQQQQESSATGPSLMHLLRPASPAPQQQQQPPSATTPQPPPSTRPLHAQEVEASLKSMLFGGAPASAAPAAATAAAGSDMPVLPPGGQARTLEEIESCLGANGVADGASHGSGCGGQDSRAIYKLIGELQVQMHDAAGPVGSAGHAAPAASGGRHTSVPSLVGGGRHSQHQQHHQQQHHLHQAQSQSQYQQPQQQKQPQVAFVPQSQRAQPLSQPPPSTPSVFPGGVSPAAAAAAAAAAAQRRLPVPLQAQQLQQLQAMLLSNLQMQAQMMHNGQLSASSAKTHPLSKLLPQTFRWYRAMNNALQGTRLLNQHFNQAGPGGCDFPGQVFEAGEGIAPNAFRRPGTGAGSPVGASAGARAGQQPQIAQPAMPIVPPMLLPPKTSGATSSAASAAAASASHQGWGGAHNQQISAMLWNATKLAASVNKSANPASWSIHRDQSGQAGQPPTVKSVDEVPSA